MASGRSVLVGLFRSPGINPRDRLIGRGDSASRFAAGQRDGRCGLFPPLDFRIDFFIRLTHFT